MIWLHKILAVLWGFSLPVTGDAIVVLSGMVRPVAAAPGAEASEWRDAIDRIEGGIALWKAGKPLRSPRCCPPGFVCCW